MYHYHAHSVSTVKLKTRKIEIVQLQDILRGYQKSVASIIYEFVRTPRVPGPSLYQRFYLTTYKAARYLGAGKHPSPLEKPKTISTNDYLTVGFYRIKKYCSDQKLLRFKDCSTRTSVTSCQPPIYRYFQRVHISTVNL